MRVPPFIAGISRVTVLSALFCIRSASGAPPSDHAALQGPLFVPTSVTLQPDGRLVLAQRVRVAGEAIPRSVPVLSVLADGSQKEGAWVTNPHQQPSSGMKWNRPVAVELALDGNWNIIASERLLIRSHGLVPPGQAVRCPGLLEVPVQPGQAGVFAAQPAPDGPLTLIFQPNAAQFAAHFGVGQQPLMDAALQRVKQRMETILSQCTGQVTIQVLFEPVAIPMAAAATNVDHLTSDYLPTLVVINERTGNLNEANYELTYYESLPSPMTFRHTTTPVLTAAKAAIAPALGRHLLTPVPPGTSDGETSIDTELQWDFDTQDKPAAPGVQDFEAAMIHETIHVLGFTSVGDIKGVTNTITVWDWFRYSEALGPTITPTEALSAVRELRPAQGVIGATILNDTNSTFPESRGLRTGGDGFQSSHWKSLTLLNPMEAVGIMDPQSGVGAVTPFRGVKRSDLRALDIIGWNLDPLDVQVGGNPPVQQQPGNGQPKVSVAPTLQWDPGVFNERWHVFVWEGPASAGTPVFSQRDLFVTSFAIPLATPLKPGVTYSWRVTGENVAGYLYSEAVTFQTCYPDCNQSASLTVADFGCFQTKFAGNDPYADCNADQLFTVADFGCFQTKFAQGCP